MHTLCTQGGRGGQKGRNLAHVLYTQSLKESMGSAKSFSIKSLVFLWCKRSAIYFFILSAPFMKPIGHKGAILMCEKDIPNLQNFWYNYEIFFRARLFCFMLRFFCNIITPFPNCELNLFMQWSLSIKNLKYLWNADAITMLLSHHLFWQNDRVFWQFKKVIS